MPDDRTKTEECDAVAAESVRKSVEASQKLIGLRNDIRILEQKKIDLVKEIQDLERYEPKPAPVPTTDVKRTEECDRVTAETLKKASEASRSLLTVRNDLAKARRDMAEHLAAREKEEAARLSGLRREQSETIDATRRLIDVVQKMGESIPALVGELAEASRAFATARDQFMQDAQLHDERMKRELNEVSEAKNALNVMRTQLEKEAETMAGMQGKKLHMPPARVFINPGRK